MAVEPTNEPSSADPGEESKGAIKVATVTTTSAKTTQKKVTFCYSREVLLSFAELDACKTRPEGLDPVIWRDSPSPEIIDNGTGSGSTAAGITGGGAAGGAGGGSGPGAAGGSGSGGSHWVAQRGIRRDRDNDGRPASESVPEWRKDSWRSGQAAGGGSGILPDQTPQGGPGIGGVRRRGFEDDPGAGGGGGPPFPVSHPPSRIGPGGSGAGGWDKGHRGGFDRFGSGPGQRSGPGPGTGGGRWEHRPGPTGEGRGFARQPQQPRDPPVELDDASGENIVLDRRGFNQGGVSLRPGWGAGEQHSDGLLGGGGAGRGRGEFRFGAGRGAPGDRYQPVRPTPIKEPITVYDEANDETFGSLESSSTANPELERKRREEFEQMRELQHRQRLAAEQQGVRSADVKTERRKYDEQTLWDGDNGLGTDGDEREGKASAGILGPNGTLGQGASDAVSSSQSVPASRPLRAAVPPGFEKKQANGSSSAVGPVDAKSDSMDARPVSSDSGTERENASPNGKSDAELTASSRENHTEGLAAESAKKEQQTVSSAAVESQKTDVISSSDSTSPSPATSNVISASAPGTSKAVGPGSRQSSGIPFPDGMWNVGLLFDPSPLQSFLKGAKAGDLKGLENEELLAAFTRLRDQGDLFLPEEGDNNPKVSDSLLDKLFQNAKADQLKSSSVAPADDDKMPKDERWTGGGTSSKFERWFKQPGRDAMVSSTQGSAESTSGSPLESTTASANLLSLLTKGRTDARMSPLPSPSPSVPTPISPQSPSQPLSLLSLQSGAARVLPMPQGPSLEAIEQAMAAEAAVGNRRKDPKKAADLQLQLDMFLQQLEKARLQNLQGSPSNVIRSQLQLEAENTFSGRLADLLGVKQSEQHVSGNSWKAGNSARDVNGVEGVNASQGVGQDGQPLVLTCQHLEQSILAEAGARGMRDMQAVRNAMPGLVDVSRMMMLMSSSERRSIASQHLLALLHRTGSAQSMAQNAARRSTAAKVMQSLSGPGGGGFGPQQVAGMAPLTPGSGMRPGLSPTAGAASGTGPGTPGGGSLRSATSIVPISVLVNNAGECLPNSGTGPPTGAQWAAFSNGARPPLGAIGPNTRPLNNSASREQSGFAHEGEMRGGVPWCLIPPQVDQGQLRQGNERGPSPQGMGGKHPGMQHQNLSSSGGPLYGSANQQGGPGMTRLSNSVGGIERKVGLGGMDGPQPPHGMMDRANEPPGGGPGMKDMGPVNVAMFFDKYRKNAGIAQGMGSPLGPMRDVDRGGHPMEPPSMMKPMKSGVSLAMANRGLLNPLGKSLGAGDAKGDDMLANMSRLSASGGSVPRMMGEPGGMNRPVHGMGMVGPGMQPGPGVGLTGMLGMPHGPPGMGMGERGGNGMVMHSGPPMGSMKPPMPPAPPGGQGMLPILSPQQQQQLMNSSLIRSQSPPPLLPIRSQHPSQPMPQPGLGPSVHHQGAPPQQQMRPPQGNPMQPQQQPPMQFSRGGSMDVLPPGPVFPPMDGMAPGVQGPFNHNGPGPFPFPPPHMMMSQVPGSQPVGFHHVGGPPVPSHMGQGGPPPPMGGGMHQRGAFLPPGPFMHDHSQPDLRGSQGQQGGMGGLYPGGGPGHGGPPMPQGGPFNHQFLQQQGVPLPPGQQMHGQRPGHMGPVGFSAPGPHFPLDVKNGEFGGGFNNSTGSGNGVGAGGGGGGGGNNAGLERWFGNEMLSHMNRQHLPAMPGGPMQQMVPLDELERKMRLP
ncbi:hypothetical protein CBR_g29315 [Chara braunii]|uniref:Uncharacterized protein n=1 Tax=Chara braunii TaxID=69332 RepID=A0A388JWE7_CHABU|nr:hypothetical protein CBR_g29315 [Chara braunii]|eukprot:GBG62115.1 hypothetical protein CBR_g29315 [Chara braunii]